MKLQVLLRSFGVPLLLTIILIIKLSGDLKPFRVFAEIVFVVSITISRLLSDDRYIQTFAIHNDRIAINYINLFLQVKSVEYALSDISDVKLSKRLPIAAIWSPILDLKVDNQRMSFHVISKELYLEIQQHLASVNNALVK